MKPQSRKSARVTSKIPTRNSMKTTKESSNKRSKPCHSFAFDKLDFNDLVLSLKIIPNDDSDSSTIVETINTSSHILSAKSTFFYKLLRNGMRESQVENDLSLTINADEEEPMMDLINFMYESTLKANCSSDLVDVLVVADKFEVTSCVKYCVEMLLKLPMSRESALVYLNLPSCVLMNEIVRPIVDASNQYFAQHFNEFAKSEKDASVSDLPLSTVEKVLGSEGLILVSEDDVFNFILEWARASYPNLRKRREIITKHLMRFICFPNLSISKLKETLICPEFNQAHASKLVHEALFYQANHRHGQHIKTLTDIARTYQNFLGRVYSPRCEVYFNIAKKELEGIFPSKHIATCAFLVGGQSFYLFVKFSPAGRQHHLSLYICKTKPVLSSSAIDYEFSVMSKSSMEFELKRLEKKATLEHSAHGRHDILGITWTQLKSNDNDYFINDVLHLRAEITLV